MRSKRLVSVLMMSAVMCASAAFGDAATQPATTRAARNPFAKSAVTISTTAPATATAPALKPAKVAVFELTNALQERPAGFKFSLFSGSTPKAPALSQLIAKLTRAARDPNIQGVCLELKSFSLTLNQAQELGKLMMQLREAKKRVVVYSSDFDTSTYLLASYADTVMMPEQGDVMIPGMNFNLMFMRNLLTKIHVEPDFIQIGKFKGAEEAFMRTSASPEYRAQIEGLADGFYQQITSIIAHNRGITEDEAKAIVDTAMMTGKQAKEKGLIDHLMNTEEVHDWIDEQFKDGAELVEDYGEPKKQKIDTSNPFAIFQILSAEKRTTRTSQPAVAVIYADAEISGDVAGQDGSDDVVTPYRIRRDVEKALNDKLVKAIVLRVDSPGGSAFASDQIWQILRSADEQKPVTVSMGRIAASGGYYIASAGRSITADPATITGSIGVVGGKFVFSGLFDWAGLNVEPVVRGKRAQMFSSTQKFTDDERAFLTQQMTEIYDLFLKRIRETRADKVKDLPGVAQGRLFTGNAALKAGLVDQVGSLQDVIAAAAKDANIDKSYQVLTYPEAKSFADILKQNLTAESGASSEIDMAIRVLPPEMRTAAVRLLRLSKQFERTQVMTVFVDGIVEK